MNKTPIEWTDYTWNPVTGCHKVSPGCKHCYAEVLTNRFGKSWGSGDFRDVKERPERLIEPTAMGRKLFGKKVFVCDMSDLFHESVSFDFIAEVFNVIRNLPDTIFQILTKRPDRAFKFYQHYFTKDLPIPSVREYVYEIVRIPIIKNIWIGVSCENQQYADERIPLLLQIPAAVRFLSCEPLLGPIDFDMHWVDGIHWVIAGGESGHGASPMHPDWAQLIRNQCKVYNIPFFFKQWGQWFPNGQIGVCELVNQKTNKVVIDEKGLWVIKVGKGKAGNLLDGVQHLNFPA